MNILITGAAGFIGFHLSRRLLEEGHVVHGLDNLNSYYDPKYKQARLEILRKYETFLFYEISLEDRDSVHEIFRTQSLTHVVNLAAQAGVRYSLENPYSYVDTNVIGFLNILEGCRHSSVEHLVFASSSSVYGLNTSMPFSVHDNVDHPISLYAATKKANELMAHTYSYLYGLPTTGLRFFTVYGPWGRPDMALFLFTKAIEEGKSIQVFNHGQMQRDFTYIDDIIEGVVRLLIKIPGPNPEWQGSSPDPSTSPAPYILYNIGNNNVVSLEDFIGVLEEHLGKRAVKDYLPMQPGDVPATYADIEDLEAAVGFRPTTQLSTGIQNFVTWYKWFHEGGKH